MSIKEFLDTNPSITQTLEYVEQEAQRIAGERKIKGSDILEEC